MVPPRRPGDVIAGKYRVERVLGRGGMGVVVAAMHLRLRERVAIKFLLPRPGGRSDVLARFVREGRSAMRIRSEHVVRVHDIGTLETGEPYLVMEYLEGRDLAAVLAREGPLPVEAAVEYVLQAIEALAEAHARGIIHRDLKPGNLFLSRRADGLPVVKVLDFGIAKYTGAGLETGSLDSTGVSGTPLYMAPEQMRSDAAIDARTDIWALGVTLYALLTGAAPFRAGSLVEIHESILRGAPPLRAARPDAPAALEAVLLRCMDKDPSKRYATVAELAEALAPLAPEHARFSAIGAARILASPILHEDTGERSPMPGDSTAPEVGDGDVPLAETEALTGTAAPASWSDAETGGATTGSPAVASPVRDAPPRARPSWQRPLALAGAAGGLVAIAGIVYQAGRSTASAPGPTSQGSQGIPAPPVPTAPALEAPPIATSAGKPPGGANDEAPPSALPAAVTSRPAGVVPRRTGPAPDRTGSHTGYAGPAPRPAAPPPVRPRDPLADPD